MAEVPNDDFPDKKPAWYRRPGCLLLLGSGLLILASIYAFCLHVPPLKISEQTTRVTGPITPDGQIDFLKHLERTTYPPEMKTDDNGFRVFLRTFGDISNTRGDEFHRRQKYEKLGLDPDEKPTMAMPAEPDTVLSHYFAQKGESLPTEYYEAFRKPWTVEDFPILADWLAEIDAPLDAAAEAIRKPHFCIPLMQSAESIQSGKPQNLFKLDFLSELQLCRSLARTFHARAFNRIATGNIDGAMEDALTIHHLGRKIADHGPLVQYLVGMAIDGLAYGIPMADNPNHPPTEKQLRQWMRKYDELPRFPALDNTFEWERNWALSFLQAVSNMGGSWDNTFDRLVIYSRRADMNIAFRHVNEAYDTLTGLAPRADLARYTVSPEPKRVAKLVLTTFGRGQLTGEVFTADLLSHVETMEEAARRTACVQNMKHLTLALLMHKADHGAFPREDWFERIKPYLGEEPERYLRCPSCDSTDEGTNYALILHEKEPADLDTLLLVELREPVPVGKAFFSPEEALHQFDSLGTPGPIGSRHHGGMNTARCDGALLFLLEVTLETERCRLLGLAPPEESMENE